jgi:hypothetical protein
MPRPYTQHTTATVRHIRQHYPRQTMPEIAAEINIPVQKLKALAQREGIRKNRLTY